MKFLFIFLNFLCLIVLPINAQTSKESIFNSIKENYQSKAFDCCILSSEGKWYFVAAVRNPGSYRVGGYYPRRFTYSERDIENIAREQVVGFFFGLSKKKYVKYTRLPQDMDNLEDLEAVYERLSKSKKYFYSMPLIGSAGTDIYFFAKAITDEAISQGEDTQVSKGNVSDTQSNEKSSVTLVVSGSGANKETAIKNALRAALEQTYGTFVSSNTQLVNDELVKDEIVSVSSGNIEKYSEISTETLKDGSISVSLQATVSIGKLVKFAQSKGASTELAGASFAMNMKMRKLNTENEVQALKHMFEKLFRICETNMFDYSIKNDQPQLKDGEEDVYIIPITINVSTNQNYANLVAEFSNTIKLLSLTDTEIEEYENSKIPFYFNYYLQKYRTHANMSDFPLDMHVALRNDITNLKDSTGKLYLDILKEKIAESAISFQISDNIGNKTIPTVAHYKGREKSELFDTKCDWPLYIKRNSEYHSRDFDLLLYGISLNKNETSDDYLGGRMGMFNVGFNVSNSLLIKKGKIVSGIYDKNYKHFIFNNFDLFMKYDSHSGTPPNNFAEYLVIPSHNATSIFLEYKESDIYRLQNIRINPILPSEIKRETISF